VSARIEPAETYGTRSIVATANGIAIHEAEIDVPFHRIWLANLTFTDDLGPAENDSVELTIGPWTGIGTCIDAGVHGGIRSIRVVAGAGGWRRAPTGLAFQNDANLSRSDIAQALASSVGETVEAESSTLGVHWSFDPTVSAGSNMDALGDWYVRNDGVTEIGSRPDAAEFRAIVEHFDGKNGIADCLIEESDVAAVMPGALVTSDSLSIQIRVRHTRILLSPNRLVAEVYTREQDPFRAARHEARKLRFLGTYRYRIIEQIAERLQLQAVDAITGLPDQLLVDKAHGLPGVTTECTPSGEVLIVFADGNRALPFVSAYLGIGPTTFGDATTADNLALAQPLIDFVKIAGKIVLAASSLVPGIVPAIVTPDEVLAITETIALYSTPGAPLTKSGTLLASPSP
jgi:hypothetical protein